MRFGELVTAETSVINSQPAKNAKPVDDVTTTIIDSRNHQKKAHIQLHRSPEQWRSKFGVANRVTGAATEQISRRKNPLRRSTARVK